MGVFLVAICKTGLEIPALYRARGGGCGGELWGSDAYLVGDSCLASVGVGDVGGGRRVGRVGENFVTADLARNGGQPLLPSDDKDSECSLSAFC